MAEYIKREAAINRLQEIASDYENARDMDAFYVADYCFRHIMELPIAADVRPVVRGEWRRYSPLTDTYECNRCGYQFIDESFRTNFFPNCGADMRGEQE